jgi:hypothetical protein
MVALSQYLRGFGRRKPGPDARIDWTHPLSRGLKACWLFNEGGLVLRDIASGGMYNATLPSSGFTWTGGRDGICVNASPAGAANGTFSALATGHTFSVDCLVFPTSLPAATYQGLLSDSGGNHGLYLGSAANSFRYYPAVSSNAVLSVNKWWHLGCAVVDAGGNSTVSYYVNGVFDSTPANAAVGSSLINILGDTTSADRLLNVNVAFVRVWVNRVLSASDFQQLYVEPYAMIAQGVTNRMVNQSAAAAATVNFRKTLSTFGSGTGKRQQQAS